MRSAVNHICPAVSTCFFSSYVVSYPNYEIMSIFELIFQSKQRRPLSAGQVLQHGVTRLVEQVLLSIQAPNSTAIYRESPLEICQKFNFPCTEQLTTSVRIRSANSRLFHNGK